MTQLAPAGARPLVDRVEHCVRVKRVVVEEQGPPGADPVGERERVLERRVAPADVGRVLLVGVLAVVDQEIGVAGKVVAGDPLVLDLAERCACLLYTSDGLSAAGTSTAAELSTPG